MAAIGNVLIVGGGIAGMTLAMALKRCGVRSEIVEINPVIDLHNKTALLGVEMALSALGKKIL